MGRFQAEQQHGQEEPAYADGKANRRDSLEQHAVFDARPCATAREVEQQQYGAQGPAAA